MQHCLQCHATMRSDETVCYVCQAEVPDKRTKKRTARYFQWVVNALMIFIGLMAVGSMFSDVFPSFIKCVGLLAVLALVKKSADTMSEFSKDK